MYGCGMVKAYLPHGWGIVAAHGLTGCHMACIDWPKASNMLSRLLENWFLIISASLSAMLKWHFV
jgi:hypothetical protein